LPGVMELFTQPGIVVAGWVHYLAFDLMIGIFIRRNAIKHRINHWLIVPSLLFTFMLGPIGLLLYLIIRTITTKQYFAENF
ncbi:MAG TPA: abscisic acid-deficient protein Aba4 family protein, partial [Chitinophagaceae bacterium]|nr:abscisic acid-deficient protein Aba4 family protein [Chitinophagaceae bacterium]